MKHLELNKKYLVTFIILIIVFFVILFTSFMIGRYSISPINVIKTLFGYGDEKTKNVFYNIRLPRILSAVFIGAALAVAGSAYQGMFRNPMVSPDLLGASSGAGFGAALAIILSLSYFTISIFSFIFGLLAVILAYLFSKTSKLNNILSMVLAGIMISSFFSAGTSFIKLIADTNSQLPAITYWLMGSLCSIKLEDIYFLIPIICISTIPLLLLSWRINLLTVGDNEAKSMGVNINLLKFIVIFCATLMTSACVSKSGIIGWVGLVIPHFSRKLFGFDYRRIFPASILLGSSFLLLTDNIARVATSSELPIGILTSFIGAPVFLYMLFGKGESHAIENK